MAVDFSGKRIGLLGIYHESNTFLSQPTTLQDFENGHLFTGDRIIGEYQDAHHEIGGILEVLSGQRFEIVPLLYAEATPGGRIDAKTAEVLLSLIDTVLDEVLPLDGLMVVPHGAAVSELWDDFDGYWLSRVRKRVGDIPVIGTLDPHANVSHKMVEATDALIAYKTNPHIDQRETGRQAARLMVETLMGDIRPVQRLLMSQVAISIEQQYTATQPCLDLYRLAGRLSQKPGVLSVSIMLGFPYADVYEMGTAFLVVSDNDPLLAEHVLDQLNEYIIEHHTDFLGPKITVDEALDRVSQLPKPVLLLDMGDNVGGGGPGDSTFILHALESRKTWRSFICIQDPQAVQELIHCASGESRSVSIGAKSDSLHGESLMVTVRVKALVDGKFTEKEVRHGGQINFDMGPTAIVETPNQTTIMLTSRRTVPFSLQQLLHYQIIPADFDIIVAKGVQAPVAAYGPVCPSVIRVNTAGVTTADMRQLKYEKRRKPLFPFENIKTPDS
jgi:microcystin degradation protein MlrC